MCIVAGAMKTSCELWSSKRKPSIWGQVFRGVLTLVVSSLVTLGNFNATDCF